MTTTTPPATPTPPTMFDGLTRMELITVLSTAPGDYQFTPGQAAALLNRSVKQLADDRTAGRKPEWVLPWGLNGSVRYPVDALREFFQDQRRVSSTHRAKIAAESAGLGFATLDALLTPGERLENLTGPGVLTVPLASVVAVLGGLGRYEVQNARDSLKCGLPDLRSCKVGRVRHYPLWQASHWLDSQVLADPEAPPVSALRASRLASTGAAYVALFDAALVEWQRADQAREAAELRALFDEVAPDLPKKEQGPRGP